MVYGLKGKWLNVLDALVRVEDSIAKKKARGQEIRFGLRHAKTCALRGLDKLQLGQRSVKTKGDG